MADPYKDNVVLYLPMEGTRHGDTVFPDKTGKTVTRNGDTILSTTVAPPFGTMSAYFDGSGDYLLGPQSSDFLFGTGDFTIEGWVYVADLSATRTVASYAWKNGFYAAAWLVQISATTGYIHFNTETGMYSGDARYTIIGVTAVQWNHFAICRKSGVLYMFVNGVSAYTPAALTRDLVTTYGDYVYVAVGSSANGGGDNLTGYIKDLRVTKGVARYTGNFFADRKPFAWDEPEQPRIFV